MKLHSSYFSLLILSAVLAVEIILLIVFFPEAFRSDQILHHAIVLFAVLLWFAYRLEPWASLPARFDRAVGAALIPGVLLFAAALPVGWFWLALIGVAFTVCAITALTVRPRSRWLLFAVASPLLLFALLALVYPHADWPLRMLSGHGAAFLLELIGKDPQLGLLSQGETVYLILVVNQHPFHVAAECNGFGIFGAALLVTVPLILFQRVGGSDAFLVAFLAAFLAMVGNLLRMVVIVLLAPRWMDHYHLMHEIVGVLAFYLVLIFMIWLVRGFGNDNPLPGNRRSKIASESCEN